MSLATLTTPASGPDTGGSPSLQQRLLRGYLHKTSNSLCGIKGYAGLIVEIGDADAGAERWARKIICEVERMEEIFRSVGELNYQRRYPDQNVDLTALVQQVITLCEHRLPGLTILCGRIPAGEILMPAADLGLILTELISNSAEGRYGVTASRRVEITGEILPTGRVAVTLRDDGEGMVAELLAQATDPFVTTKEGHLGVGLARVETLLEMYELAWALRSTAGSGTTVTLEVADSLTAAG